MRRTLIAIALTSFTTVAFASPDPVRVGQAQRKPSVLVITVDALRADRLSYNGYQRPTSPAIDELASHGARFSQASTLEPLTAPSMVTMLTSRPPHRHGATRNGLQMEDGLQSLPRVLGAHGWATAAFVGNWTLRDKTLGLGDHFDHYEAVLNRKRWLGLINGEATGEDLTEAAVDWLDDHLDAGRPVLLWAHYVEPHAPYRFQSEWADRLGISRRSASRADRYDTEVAAADHWVGRLLAEVRDRIPTEDLIVVFAADHGESLGEHGYWGHGRFLYQQTVHVPMVISWPGHVPPQAIDDPAALVDIAPSVLGLLGLDPEPTFEGLDWSPKIRGGTVETAHRGLCIQAHKGAIHVKHDSDRARSVGLLRVGFIQDRRKLVLDIGSGDLEIYDLRTDPGERVDLGRDDGHPSDELLECVGDVTHGLGALDRLAATDLDDESVEQLRALGYLE